MRTQAARRHRAIGWIGDRLFSVKFEIREVEEGEYCPIAAMTDRGKSVARFFTGKGKMMPPIQRVNVDFTAPMLKELDDAASELNISRQAVIKSLLRQALDRQNMARKAR